MSDGLTDHEFLRALEDGSSEIRFGHPEHLRMAWIQHRRHGRALGADATADLIRRIAASQGQADRYHETMTRFWFALVAHVSELHPDEPFGDVLAAHPQLTDKSLPLRHYSEDALLSARARREFVPPDRVPLP
jgi:hypothetical protein